MGKSRRNSAKSTSDTIKVLFCTNAFEKTTNGPAMFAQLLLRNAASTGMELRILTEDVTDSAINVYKLPLHISKFARPFGQFIRMGKYHKFAMGLQKSFPFDYLVYNNALVGLWSIIKYPGTVGMINDYSNASSRLKNVIIEKRSLNKRQLFHFVEKISVRLCEKIIVNSEYSKKYLSNTYHARGNKFHILHKGINNNLIDRVSSKETKRTKNSILFVKTDFKLGGLFDLIDAINLLNFKIQLTIIGPPDEYHESLYEKVKKNCSTLVIKDHASQEEIFDTMLKHEIFCVPSHKEAFGVANVEAMACGCKIVSTKVGGIPEAVGCTGVGWLVSPNNPKELNKAIEEAFNTDIDSKRIQVADHLQNFTTTRVVQKFRSILEN